MVESSSSTPFTSPGNVVETVKSVKDQHSILAKLDFLRANTNFSSKQFNIIDKQLVLNVFVNYEKVDMDGN